MKTSLIILTFFIISISDSVSQARENVKFVNTLRKQGYLYIPGDVFKDSNNAIVFQDLSLDKKVKRKDIDLHWTTDCGDGTSYYLTITPEQMYLMSGHNNPNPNFLFWVMGIDSLKYQKIRNSLLANDPPGFSMGYMRTKNDRLNFYDTLYKDTLLIPETWTTEDQLNVREYCNKKFYVEIEKLFSIINSYLANDKISFPSQKELSKIKPKYAGAFQGEIMDWLPHKKKGK